MVKSGNSLREGLSTSLHPNFKAVDTNCSNIAALHSEDIAVHDYSQFSYSSEILANGATLVPNYSIDQHKNYHNFMETTYKFPLTALFVRGRINVIQQAFLGLLMFISFGLSLQAQDNLADGSNIRFSKTMAIVMDKILPFGSKLGMDSISPTVTWEIVDGTGIIASGSGNGLNDFVFAVPGNYEISIHENITFEPGSCKHNTCPDMIQLKVSNTRMTFHHDEITFSDPIRVETETQGISMNVPVTIERYNAFLPLEYNFTEVKSAGIQTDITADLMAGTLLREGKQTLVYQLKGKAHKPAYLMFDFIDINGMVQSFAMQNPVLQ